ncbi:hypothetical protein [Paenibacillus agricola]|uniref:Uncharacterized protein n=1 Tax=Paenibacillus agricola TaxID=2716264 RepID=A0ABX0JFE0_9BACL|nr:hypothetical protein [Paenibacillus agricola]NHN34105.1 hypothetical protein [Paenibacillus agricola]
MRIRVQSQIGVNVKAVVKDSIIHVSEEELKRDIRSIVAFWAEQRLREDGWPIPNSTKDIREYLIENGVISEVVEEDQNLY